MNKEPQASISAWEKELEEEGKAVTHIKHDCHNYRHNVFEVSDHYKLEKCSICDRIVWFRWNSFWKRFMSLFFSYN